MEDIFRYLLKYSLDLRSKKTRTITSPVQTLLQDKLPKYKGNLNSYISACQEDPELKSFDSLLRQQTNKMVTSLFGQGGKTEYSSLDSVMVVCQFLVDQNQNVTKIILDTEEKNEELKALVDLYSESTTRILDLFNTVEKCVEKAKKIQLMIRVAIKQFETESMDKDFRGKNKYKETLEDLNKVLAMGDPFGDEFTTQYEAIYKEQFKLLDKFRELEVEISKKQSKQKKRRILGNVVFATVYISVIALSMLFAVATLPVAPTVALQLMIAPTQLGAAAGGWVNKMLMGYEKVYKKQIDLLLLTENNTKVNIEAMKMVKNLVESLVIKISSILEAVEVAVEKRDDEATKLVMQEIMKKVEGFAEKIEEVGTHVAECSKVVGSGRVRVLKLRARFH